MDNEISNEVVIKKPRGPYKKHKRMNRTGDHDILIKRISQALTPDAMQRAGLDLLPTSVVRDLADQLGVKDVDDSSSMVDIEAHAVRNPVEKLVHEIMMNSLRVRGVASKEGLEAAREEFNSCLSALDKVFQIAVGAASDHDEELTEIMREYINTMSMELYNQKIV